METDKRKKIRDTCILTGQKLKEKILPHLSKKRIIALLALVAIATGAIIGLNLWKNSYKTPIHVSQYYLNSIDKITPEKEISLFTNGLGKSELKKIYRLLKDSDYFLDWKDEQIDDMIENADYLCKVYGDDYSFKFTMEEKTKLTSAELREYRSTLQDDISRLNRILDYAAEFDTSDWGEFADTLDLTKTDAKKLIELLSDLQEDLGRLEVTKGYELEYKSVISGSYLEEPEESSATMIILKVNGRWIHSTGLYYLGNFLRMISYAM